MPFTQTEKQKISQNCSNRSSFSPRNNIINQITFSANMAHVSEKWVRDISGKAIIGGGGGCPRR